MLAKPVFRLARNARWGIIITAVLVGQGCEATVPLCTEATFAVVVEVRDSVSNSLLRDIPTGVIMDGEYRETMRASSEFVGYSMSGGLGRPGTYDVEVRAAGYRPWRLEGVEVRHDGCHVQTVELVARMVPVRLPAHRLRFLAATTPESGSRASNEWSMLRAPE